MSHTGHTADVKGTVSHPDGKPFEGVQVTIWDPTLVGHSLVADKIAVTNAKGKYSIQGLAPGSATITAQRATGVSPGTGPKVSRKVNLKAGDTKVVDLNLH